MSADTETTAPQDRASQNGASQHSAWTDNLLDNPHQAPDKAQRVQRMFNGIAPTYERINAIFSLGRDRAWRKKAVQLAQVTPNDDVLDIASGTGDLARTFYKAGPRKVVGCDFAHEMIIRAAHRQDGPNLWCEADAQHLPFADGSFSITSCAFGIRNFQDLSAGLAEMARVLRPGGRAIILEFTTPPNPVVRTLNNFYSARFMPLAASWISGDRNGAYKYLPKSVSSFIDSETLCQKLQSVGFARVTETPMTMGIVSIYKAIRD